MTKLCDKAKILFFGYFSLRSAGRHSLLCPFNIPLSVSDRLIVVDSAGTVSIFGVNSSTGAITLQTTLTLTSPSLVAAHPSDGTFFVLHNTSSLNCYQYDSRRGTGPTLGSTTNIGSLSAMTVTPDGGTLVYGKAANGTVFWRSVANCTVGSEESVSRSGGGEIGTLYFSDDGTAGILAETGGTKATSLRRVLSSGAISVRNTIAATSSIFNAWLTPNGQYGLLGDSTNLRIWDLDSTA